MDGLSKQVKTPITDEVFAGGGEMGALMRSLDWSTTPLGPVENWPQSLRTAVSICLASHLPVLIWWGPELVKLYNDAYRPLLGATKHPGAMGQRGRESWPEIWDTMGPMLEGVLREGKAAWSENQLLLLERNGYHEERYFTFSYSPIRDESGGVGGVFTTVIETTQNVRLYQNAQDAIRLRDELFSTVSHDLKNPIATIKGFAQLLKRMVSRTNLPDKVQQAQLVNGLSRIDLTATRMTALINELLDITYLQIGKPLNLDLRETDLVRLAHQAVISYQQTTEHHKFHIEVGEPEMVGWWDTVRLERVLGNLLSNAIKYSPDGGIITVKVTKEEGEWAVLSVEDQGVGIPADDLPHIFDRFHRATHVGGQIKGSGIGLASACQIIKQHDGTITVTSQEGKGSTFIVRLPLNSPDADANA